MRLICVDGRFASAEWIMLTDTAPAELGVYEGTRSHRPQVAVSVTHALGLYGTRYVLDRVADDAGYYREASGDT